MYQVGQAVISSNNGLLYFIHRIEGGGSFNYNYLSNLDGSTLPVPCYDNEMRPATEAEILEQAVEHGWKEDEIFFSATGVISIGIEKDVWIYQFEYLEDIKDLSLFGQECITAHRLITSLNLVK